MLLSDPTLIESTVPSLYGSQEIGMYYHDLKNFIKERKLNYFRANETEINICNYWKICVNTKTKSGLSFYKFCLKTNEFIPLKNPKGLLKYIPILVHSKQTNTFTYLKSLASTEMIEYFHKNKSSKYNFKLTKELENKITDHTRYLFTLMRNKKNLTKTGRTKKIDKIGNAQRYYSRILHKWIIDNSNYPLKQTLSEGFKLGIFIPSKRYNLSFGDVWAKDYSKIIKLRDKFISDQSNLAPLAAFLDSKVYSSDLLSYHNINKGLKLTFEGGGSLNFKLSKNNYRLIKILPVFVIQEWIRLINSNKSLLNPYYLNRNNYDESETISVPGTDDHESSERELQFTDYATDLLVITAEALKLYNFKPYTKLLTKFIFGIFECVERYSPNQILSNTAMRGNLINLLRITYLFYEKEYSNESAKDKYCKVSKYLTLYSSQVLNPIIDYLIAHQDYAVTKSSSLKSLINRVNYWHLVLSTLDTNKTIEELEEDSWSPTLLYNEFVSEKFTITELRSAADLFLEGKELQHCVYSYLDRCRPNYRSKNIYPKYIVFSVKSKFSNERSTIGFRRVGNQRKYTFDQHQGKENLSVPKAHTNAVKELIGSFKILNN